MAITGCPGHSGLIEKVRKNQSL